MANGFHCVGRQLQIIDLSVSEGCEMGESLPLPSTPELRKYAPMTPLFRTYMHKTAIYLHSAVTPMMPNGIDGRTGTM
jgi:hypothetical protein